MSAVSESFAKKCGGGKNIASFCPCPSALANLILFRYSTKLYPITKMFSSEFCFNFLPYIICFFLKVNLILAMHEKLTSNRSMRLLQGCKIYMGLDVRLSEWCCSVTMVWVQIPSREEQKFDSYKI